MSSDAIETLVVDDMRVFTFPAVYARTWQRAQELLINTRFESVWFDHDLGYDVVTGMFATTRPLILWIEEQAHYGRAPDIGQCFIHTSNPVGARWMLASLGNIYPTVLEAAPVKQILSLDETAEAQVVEHAELGS